MEVKHQEELRTDFKKLLYELAQAQDASNDTLGRKRRSDFYKELERLYSKERFQHYTTDIFIVLKNLQRDGSKGNIDILGRNLELIRRGYNKNVTDNKDSAGIELNVQKLYDDVNLEISRILSDEADTWKFSQENKIRQLNKEIMTAHDRLSDTEEKLKMAEKKIESSQKEYIAILGIFAAIILAFTGGITFSTSVLENIHKASIYRVILVILLVGFTLVNVLYLLFMFIDKLVRNDKRVIPINPLITFDISVIAFVIIVIVLWATGFVEGRNQNVNAGLSQANSFTSEITDSPKEDGESSELELNNYS